MSDYRREDVLRILHLPDRQLALWEKAGLMSPAEAYTFDHLVQLRKLRDLAGHEGHEQLQHDRPYRMP